MSTSLNIIADRLTKELGSWSSVEFRQHVDFRREGSVSTGENLFTSYRSETRYIETGLGERLLESKLTPSNPKEETLSIDYCDGKLAANFFRRTNVASDQDQVVIKRTFATERNGSSVRPFPLGSLYVGGQSIDKAISRATPLGTNRFLDRDCDRIIFTDVTLNSFAYSCVFDLDPDTSIPLRVISYIGEEMRRRDVPTYEWGAEKLERIEGHPVATLSNYVHFDGPPESQHVAFRIRTAVDRVEFNQTYPKETFWPKITSETRVFDTVKKTVKAPKANPATKTATGAPIRADDDRATLPVAGIAIVLGLLLIVGAVALARRRA